LSGLVENTAAATNSRAAIHNENVRMECFKGLTSK
jgi:hypothetical protein